MGTIRSEQEVAWEIENREKQIEIISAILKGPLTNVDRQWHVADRKELRQELASLKNELAELTTSTTDCG